MFVTRRTMLTAIPAALALPLVAGRATAQNRLPSTITVYNGTVQMGAGFSFTTTIVWDTGRGVLRARGEINWGVRIAGKNYGVRMLASDADARIINGNTLEINKVWKGGSGARVDSVIHLTPQGNRIVWSVSAVGYNSNLPRFGRVTHRQSGSFTVNNPAWQRR